MASLIDSIRNIKSDSFWFIKILFFSALVFAVLYESYYYPPYDGSILIIEGILLLFFLGCASITVNRNINNKSPLFPGLFSIPELIIKTIGSAIAVLPGLMFYYICLVFIQTKLVFEPVVMLIIYIGATIIFSPFIFVPFVLYSVNGKLYEAFNLKIIFNSAGNFCVQFMSYILNYILILGVITLIIYFILLNMFGDNVSLLILKCVVIVISFFSMFLYFSDLYGDVIPEIEKKKKKLKSKAS